MRLSTYGAADNQSMLLTVDKRPALRHVDTPGPDIAVHLHRTQNKILINIQIDCGFSVELGIAVYAVALRLG
jgi:hypothetical protein